MRCKRVFALVWLSICLTACGNNIANEQNDGASYGDFNGDTTTISETVVKESETTVQISNITEAHSSITEIDSKEYLKVLDLKPNISVNTQDLICFNGEVYGRSFKLIDYAGGTEPVGTISSLISTDLVPQFDGETNQEYLLNVPIYESTSSSVVVLYNGEYVLFENIYSEQDSQAEDSPTIGDLIKSNPNIIGIVEEVHDNYIILYSETMDGYPNGARWSIPLDVENTNIYTDISVGDEIVVCYDGFALETDPLRVRTVYAIAPKSDIEYLL